MPYTPPSETDVISNMINTYASLGPTADDLNPGAVVRSILETVGREFKNLYVNQTEDAAELQETSAYSMFNFSLNPAVAAYTMEQFTIPTAPTTATPVPAGTLVSIPGTTVQYQTVSDTTWPAGQTSISVRIVCTQAGSLGNTPAGTITQLVSGLNGLPGVTVTNVKDVITGADIETELERAQRYQKFIAMLHRGDIDALREGAMTAQIIDDYGYVSEQITKAQVVEGAGSNTIYVDNGTYDTSTAMITQCQQVIDGYIDTSGNFILGYKAAGIPSTVVAATIQGTTIVANVQLEPGYTLDMVQQTIIDSLTKLVQSLNVGDTLYLADIRLAIGNVPGVLNHTVSSPVADVVPAAGTLLQLSATPTITAN